MTIKSKNDVHMTGSISEEHKKNVTKFIFSFSLRCWSKVPRYETVLCTVDNKMKTMKQFPYSGVIR